MKHAICAGLAAIIAALLTSGLTKWGAHDLMGLYVALVGFPGYLAAGLARYGTDLQREFLFTLVNWLFYFAVFEGLHALKQRYDR